MARDPEKPDTAPRQEALFRLEDYRPPDYLITTAKLTFELGHERVLVTSELQIERAASCAADTALWLDGAGQPVLEIELDSEPLKPEQWIAEPEGLRIFETPTVFSLRIVIEVDPRAHEDLMGLSVMGKHLVTQCEPDGFRRITYFTDRPDVSCQFDVRLIGDPTAFPVLLSNGNPAGSGTLPDGRHWADWHDPWPKPCYLFALLAGPLEKISDRVVLGSGKQVNVNVYADAQDIDKMALALQTLQHAITWDEQHYQLEYDLDVFNIGVLPKFPFGGMENKGLNLFDATAITTDKDCATDLDAIYNEATVAHEYFHNWTGNRVTIRDWCQLTVKEGVTVHRHQQYMESRWPSDWMRINDVKMLWARQFPEDAGGTAHPVRPDHYAAISNFYTATVYEKGAELIRMLRTFSGEEAFHAAMRSFLKQHDGSHATLEQLLDSFQGMLPPGVSDSFIRWFESAGTPRVEAMLSQTETGTELQLRQQEPALPIPLKIAWIREDGQPSSVEQTLCFAESLQSISNNNKHAAPSINRDYSAPIILEGNQTIEHLKTLALHDDNGFCRWEALRRLTRMAVNEHMAGQTESKTLAVLSTCHREISLQAVSQQASAEGGQLLLSELLALPDWNELAALVTNGLDPLKLDYALESVRFALAKNTQDIWLKFSDQRSQPAYALTPQQVGERCLRKIALESLRRSQPDRATTIAEQILNTADNITDRNTALRVLVHSGDSGITEWALKHFLRQGSHELLTRNLWLLAQSQSKHPEVLTRLDQLLASGACDLKTPSQTRAVIGGFGDNILHFHAEDDSGYQWAGRWISHIAEFNDEVAARLVARLPWGNLPSYTPAVQAGIRAALETLMHSAPKQASALRDVTQRILAQ